MKFSTNTTMTKILDNLFKTYAERIPDVKKITNEMINKRIVKNQSEIINDHVAFRTMGVKNLGIASFEKIFLAHGYKKRDFFHFRVKKLDAYWYTPPTDDLPRIFISELNVNFLSKAVQKIIRKYTNSITTDPLDQLDLNDSKVVSSYFQTPLWSLPTIEDFETLIAESEYAAWVIYNRYYLNHYTISVHDLPEPYCYLESFNKFLKSIGIQLNTSGGEIKISKDELLRQTSSVANKVIAQFSGDQTKEIAGSYVEFAERGVLPQFTNIPKNELKREHRREGFETGNADRIFESTFTTQLNKN